MYSKREAARRVLHTVDTMERVAKSLDDGALCRASGTARGLRDATRGERGVRRRSQLAANNALLNGCRAGFTGCVRDIKGMLARGGFRFYARKRNGRFYLMLEPAGGGDAMGSNEEGAAVWLDDGYDIISVACFAVERRYPRVVIRIGVRTIGDVPLLWAGGECDEFYDEDAKTVELVPTCDEGGEEDGRGFRWAGTVVYRSKGVVHHSYAYTSDPMVLFRLAFFAFVYCGVDEFVEKRLWDENNAARWLDSGTATMR